MARGEDARTRSTQEATGSPKKSRAPEALSASLPPEVLATFKVRNTQPIADPASFEDRDDVVTAIEAAGLMTTKSSLVSVFVESMEFRIPRQYRDQLEQADEPTRELSRMLQEQFEEAAAPYLDTIPWLAESAFDQQLGRNQLWIHPVHAPGEIRETDRYSTVFRFRVGDWLVDQSFIPSESPALIRALNEMQALADARDQALAQVLR